MAKLSACEAAVLALIDASRSSLPLEPVPQTLHCSLEQAEKQLLGDARPTVTAARQELQRARDSPLRPLYDALRRGSPGVIGRSVR